MTKNVYGVSQVNRYIKNMFAQDFMMHQICVKGEVSNCKYHSSGHIYFTMKEAGSAMNAVMFAGNRKGLSFRMKDGDEVQVTGSVEVYERDGRYQLYARQIELAGEGDLYLRFQRLKQELEEMGMFAPEYKKPIPKYARRVGIVTAPTGAAIQDIRNIAARRNPYVQLILYPALVQGDGSVESVIQGIRTLDAMGLDVLIVGRGGGSIEDLWTFNEEAVARAVFECETPIISAVGHETDTTITDYAADLRAPTPSAAAELAVYDVMQQIELLEKMKKQLNGMMHRSIMLARSRSSMLQAKLQQCSPKLRLNAQRQYADELEMRMTHRMQRLLDARKNRMRLVAAQLADVSPIKRLGGGYAYIKDEAGRGIRSIGQMSKGGTVDIVLKDGTAKAVVDDIKVWEEDATWVQPGKDSRKI